MENEKSSKTFSFKQIKSYVTSLFEDKKLDPQDMFEEYIKDGKTPDKALNLTAKRLAKNINKYLEKDGKEPKDKSDTIQRAISDFADVIKSDYATEKRYKNEKYLIRGYEKYKHSDKRGAIAIEVSKEFKNCIKEELKAHVSSYKDPNSKDNYITKLSEKESDSKGCKSVLLDMSKKAINDTSLEKLSQKIIEKKEHEIQLQENKRSDFLSEVNNLPTKEIKGNSIHPLRDMNKKIMSAGNFIFETQKMTYTSKKDVHSAYDNRENLANKCHYAEKTIQALTLLARNKVQFQELEGIANDISAENKKFKNMEGQQRSVDYQQINAAPRMAH